MIGVNYPASLPLNACHSWCEHGSVNAACGLGYCDIYQVHMEVPTCALVNELN